MTYPLVAWEDRPVDPIPVLRRHWVTILAVAFLLYFISWWASEDGIEVAYRFVFELAGFWTGAVIGGEIWRNRPRWVAQAAIGLYALGVAVYWFGEIDSQLRSWLLSGIIAGLFGLLSLPISWWRRQRQADRTAG